MRLANLDLLVLLAYQLQVNWDGIITLCMAVDDEATREEAIIFLQRLIKRARMPQNTKTWVEVGRFEELLAAAPDADLNLFGLPPEQDVGLFVRSWSLRTLPVSLSALQAMKVHWLNPFMSGACSGRSRPEVR